MLKSYCNDPLFDFNIIAKQGKLYLETGNAFPDLAKNYLSNYIKKTHKYINILNSCEDIRFSLYQPQLNKTVGKRSLYYRLKRKYDRIRLPAVATIGITRHCQCVCEHCSADYHMNSVRPDLSTVEFMKALNQTVQLGVTNILMLGGEPLINKNISSLIKSVDPNMASVCIFTNGELLTKEKCLELKQSGLSGIFVSLDSPTQIEHDEMRMRPGLFQKALTGIKNAIQLDIPVAISSYLTTSRVENGYFEKMMQLGRDMKVNEITFFDAIPVGRMSDGRCTYLTSRARAKISDLTKSYRKNRSFPAVTPQSILTSTRTGSFCFAANTQFYLSASGEFCPCDFTPLSIGKFPDKDIAQLWKEIISTDLYKRRSKTCRMQDANFRSKTIDQIPKNARLPYRIAKLEKNNIQK